MRLTIMKEFFALLLILSASWNIFAQNMEARFLEITGTVEIRAENSPDWQRAEPGGLIERNTVISTGFKSSAVISLGSSRLDIRPLTMLTLEELTRRDDTEETSLYLRSGRIRAVVTPPTGQGVDFTVGSPVVTASVRGTSFEFDGRHLRVEDGRVLLTGLSGQKVYVAGIQRSYADESNQNRIVPPFEAEAALLRPVIPEINNTGSGTEPPETGASGAGVSITVNWP
jgi:hypothetical protein